MDLVVTAGLLVAALAVASLSTDRQLALAHAVRATALFPFVRLHAASAERARVAERLAALRLERDSLTAEVLRLRQLADDALDLRRLAGMGDFRSGSLVAADLFAGRPRLGSSDLFMLEGAGLAGMRPPTAVLTGVGVVGVLRTVDGAGGVGEFWTHPDFRVSVRTLDGSASGIVRAGPGPDGQPVMLLEGAPYQVDIPRGTELVTTGLTGIYPPGVLVGTVTSVSRVESGWAKSYFVRPAVRPEDTNIVLVWRPSAEGV